MSQVIFKRGKSEALQKQELQDGLISFTTDDGKIHLDYIDENNTLVRKTFYSGKLIFGTHVYDGSEDVQIDIYDGSVTENTNS